MAIQIRCGQITDLEEMRFDLEMIGFAAFPQKEKKGFLLIVDVPHDVVETPQMWKDAKTIIQKNRGEIIL